MPEVTTTSTASSTQETPAMHPPLPIPPGASPELARVIKERNSFAKLVSEIGAIANANLATARSYAALVRSAQEIIASYEEMLETCQRNLHECLEHLRQFGCAAERKPFTARPYKPALAQPVAAPAPTVTGPQA